MSEGGWDAYWGRQYRQGEKDKFNDVLADYDLGGLLGDVIVDVGSGAHPAVERLPARDDDRKVINIDFARPPESTGPSMEWPTDYNATYDIGRINDGSYTSAKLEVNLARFLGIDPRTASKEKVDSIICSNIFNYIDWKRTVRDLSAYLRPEGRFFVNNLSDFGLDEHFHKDRPIDALDIINYFEKELGYAREVPSAGTSYPGLIDSEMFVFRKPTAGSK